jgi:hypothetical protein
LLKVGALALGGATLADWVQAKARGTTQRLPQRDLAVIQVFMGGGPSHIDMYDLKPNAPAEIRGEFRAIDTCVSGIRICEHLPLQAAQMDKIALVRSVSHHNPSHLPSSHLILTGYEPPVAQRDNSNPFVGSVVAKLRGPIAPAMPAYVAVPRRVSFGGSAYLGAADDPFMTEDDPNSPTYRVRHLALSADLSAERLEKRSALLRSLDRLRRQGDAAAEIQALDDYSQEALRMITGRKAAEALDISREDARVRDHYGRTSIGQNCLLARRLVEAGVRYVTCMSGGGWDTHVNNFAELKNVALPRYDRAVATLVSDLHERGLFDRVLVMAFGEFGRTPSINRDAGRDHWPSAMCVLFAGGGLKVGQVIGATDSRAAFPSTMPYSPRDVLATMYHQMGIDWKDVFHDQTNRPMPILPDGQTIVELI